MLRKPWPIIILTTFFLLVPISNILSTFILNSHKTNFYNFLYSLIYLPSNHFKVLNLILPSLLAAFATWSVKRWSYIILTICAIWISINGFYNLYQYYGQLNTLQILLAIVAPILFSIFMLLYFLIPTVKTTYFDPKLRWWEAKPRYLVNLKATLNENKTAVIENISEGGLYFATQENVELNTPTHIFFRFNSEEFSIQVTPVFKNLNTSGYGSQISQISEIDMNRLKRGILQLSTSREHLVRPIPMWDEDLKKWLKNLLSGKGGITPKIPKKYKSQSK